MENISKYGNGEISWYKKKYPNIVESSGDLGVIEFGKEFDFDVKRVFFLRNLTQDTLRGLHSHKDLKQIIICLNGAFTISLNNGIEQKVIEMKADDNYLYLDGKVWREMKNFAEHTVIMVLCDREYRFDEVVREFSVFEKNVISVNDAI